MSKSSGFGAAISFHRPDRIVRSGAQPNSTSGANDSPYSSRCGSGAPPSAGARSMPSTSGIVPPSSRSAVGATSASVTAPVIRAPAPTPGPLMMSGTRSVVS